jgi:haloalkane dehalogenase
MVDQFEMAAPEWLNRAEFPFQSRWLQTSAGRVHYVDEGPRDGEVVLLVHGTPTWSFEYRHVIPLLARTRRVIAIDHLGFGLSERPREFSYTPEAHTEVMREAIEKLGLGHFALVVHDYGGPIALPIAAAEPERVTSLVVLNSWMWPLTEDAELAKGARFAGSWLGRQLYRWLNFSLRVLLPYAYGDRKKLTPAVYAQYLAPFRRPADRVLVLWALARALRASAPALGRLWDARVRLAPIPALVLWGLGDRALPPRLLERFRQAWPQARIQELAGVGHWPHEEAPAEVARVLDEFLPQSPGAQAKLARA